MKIETKDNQIVLTEVYNSIQLKTNDGETLDICMRDSGFEFKYNGELYFAKQGEVSPFHKSVRGNYFVEQKPRTYDANNSNIGHTQQTKAD